MQDRSEVRSVFGDLLAQPVQARSTFLQTRCHGDASLLAEVKSLWTSHEEAGNFLGEPTVETQGETGVLNGTSLAILGTSIGRYKLLEQIGTGGFGTVYLAAQETPIRRQVALKIIKRGMDTGQVIARFEAERQLLAMMDHPHIARVLDAGETDEGSPYFVMELVLGLPLTRFCDEQRLNLPQRLALFMHVCLAVQHAHQKGVIHRDIKPSNVLVAMVDGASVPKVIDFGIAKAMVQGPGDKSPPTEGAHFVGTPEYMSPEQAEMGSTVVDTRADIYALGVLLYELLTGRTPLDRTQLRGVSHEELCRILHDVEPPSLSARFEALAADERQTVSQRRGADPRKHAKVLRGELVWIVKKCLEKNPAGRYESVGDVVRDIQAYLNNEPIVACPQSRGYLYRKFLSRHKKMAWSSMTAAAALVLLAMAALAAATQYRKLAEERETARLQVENSATVMRHNLYENNMYLANMAVVEDGGLARVGQLLAHWRNSRPEVRGWEWYYLNSLCNRDLLVLRGHAASALCVTWSVDGARLASCGADGTIKIWDAATGRELQSFTVGSGTIRQVSWSPDGKRLASIGNDKTVRIWNLASGSVEFQCPSGTHSVSWSRDGVRVAWEGPGNSVVVCDIFSKKLRTLQTFTSPVECLAWSSDASHQLAACSLHRVYIWDDKLNSDVPVVLSTDHIDINSLAWNKEGNRLAAAGTVGLNGTGPIRNAIATWEIGRFDDIALPWETPADDVNSSGHAGGVDAIAWNPEGNDLASASQLDWKIRVWDGRGRQTSWFRGGSKAIYAIAWSPNGERLAWASEDGTIRIRDAASDESPKVPSGRTAYLDSASWNPEGTLLATGSTADGTVLIHNLLTGKALSLPFSGSPAFSPVENQLAVVAASHKIYFVNALDGQKLGVIEAASALGNPTWSPDGKYLACTCGADQTVRIFAVATGIQTQVFPGATAVAWSSYGTRIATGTAGGGAISIIDVGSGHELLRLIARGMHNLAWSPDGKRLASGHDDGIIRVFDAIQGKDPLVTCGDHTAGIVSLSWSPNSSRLASTCRNEVTKVWDPNTGHALLSMHGDMPPVAWSPNSLALACENRGHDIAILDASMGYAVERSPKALAFLDRQLTLDPTDVRFLQLRADINVGKGQWDTAASDINAYLAQMKGNPMTWFETGLWLSGPYPGDVTQRNDVEDNPDPRSTMSGSAEALWQPLPLDPNGYMDLGGRFAGTDRSSFYAMERVYSPFKQNVTVLVGIDTPYRLCINGRTIQTDGMGTVPRSIPSELNAGWNTLLIRMVQNSTEVQPYLRVVGR